MAALSALDFVTAAAGDVPPVVAVFGDDAFLKRHCLQRIRQAVLGDEGELSLTTFEGPAALLADVLDELETVAMFGPGRRLAVVDDADPFVTRYRAELEDYVARPAKHGVLVLLLASFPSNTRLYKAAAASGLLVDCSAPAAAKLPRWLATWAKQSHAAQLNSGAAEALIEITGAELGLLDQEIGRLALLAGEGRRITPELVGQSAGGWRTKTTWEMLDAALAGNVPEAMKQLDRLLSAGETPIGLLGQISASLRRYAAATRLVLLAEARGRRPSLREALTEAGVRSFVLQKAERELRRLGRNRGRQLYAWLLQADLDLKGDSVLAPRLILERLLLRIAAV